MTEPEERVRDRQAGDYEPPILQEPQGGPMPPWRSTEDDSRPGSE